MSNLVRAYAENAQALIVSLRAATSKVSGASGSLGAMVGPSEGVPDLGMLLELLARRIEHDRAELERADQQATAESIDPVSPRARRDDAAHELYATLIEVRRTVSGFFGAEWVKRIGLPTELRENATAALLTSGREVSAALKGRALPKPALDGVRSVDLKPLQKRLRRAVKALEAASAEIGARAIDLGDANAGKAKATRGLLRSFSAASKIAIGVLELAGDDAATDVPAELRRARPPKKKVEAAHGPGDSPDPVDIDPVG